MSQYTIAGKRAGVTALIGWDRPLRSYFCTIYDPARSPLHPQESDATRHVGLLGEPYDIMSVEELQQAVVDDVDITPALATQLRTDQQE